MTFVIDCYTVQAWGLLHYCDVIMGVMASQITSLTTVFSNVYSSVDQMEHQSSASLAFVNSPHKWPVTRKMFLFDDVIMNWLMLPSVWLVSLNIAWVISHPRWIMGRSQCVMESRDHWDVQPRLMAQHRLGNSSRASALSYPGWGATYPVLDQIWNEHSRVDTVQEYPIVGRQ